MAEATRFTICARHRCPQRPALAAVKAPRWKTAGRGTQGYQGITRFVTGFEGGQLPLHMRLPKLRGFKNPSAPEYRVVNLDRIQELFPNGGDVTVEALVARVPFAKNESS